MIKWPLSVWTLGTGTLKPHESCAHACAHIAHRWHSASLAEKYHASVILSKMSIFLYIFQAACSQYVHIDKDIIVRPFPLQHNVKICPHIWHTPGTADPHIPYTRYSRPHIPYTRYSYSIPYIVQHTTYLFAVVIQRRSWDPTTQTTKNRSENNIVMWIYSFMIRHFDWKSVEKILTNPKTQINFEVH